VEVFQRSRNFSRVESRSILVDALIRPCLERSEELTTTAVFHAEVEMVFGLERVVESNNKGVVAGRQDFLLGQCALDLVPLDHLFFAQD
jgi:hypothetical protein